MGIFYTTQGAQTGALWQAERWDGEEDGREVRKGGDMGALMADSYWYMTETTKFCKAITLQLKNTLKRYINKNISIVKNSLK